MDGVKNLLISFFEENQDKGVLLSKEEILKLDNSLKISQYISTSDSLKQKYPNTSVDDIIIGFKEGVFFTENNFYIMKTKGMTGWDVERFEIEDFLKISGTPKGFFSTGKILVDNVKIKSVTTSKKVMFELFEILKSKISELINENQLKRIEEEKVLNQRKEKVTNFLDSFELDQNGEPQLVDGESFNLVLQNNEENISVLEKEYSSEFTLKFVRLSSFLRFKQESIILTFNSLKEIDDIDNREECVEMLKDQIHTYNQFIVYSLNMITSLLENKKILFYRMYELFDGLGVFNSQLENDMKKELENVNTNIVDVVRGINKMETKISSSLSSLGNDIKGLNQNVTSQLQKVNSKLFYNNVVNTINTYQTYKLRKELKQRHLKN